MRQPDEAIDIQSRDYWFKIVEFLQQNWALIDQTPEGVVVWFFGDTSGVFDQMAFASAEEAQAALLRNGFRRYADDPDAKNFIAIAYLRLSRLKNLPAHPLSAAAAVR